MTIKKKLKREAVQILKNVDILKNEAIEESLATPPQSIFGDLATNICFSISRKLKKPPQVIATEIVSRIKIQKASFINKVETEAGYVNFFFDYPKLAAYVLNLINKMGDVYGSCEIGEGEKVIVEFSSVNPGKPWHIGHVRNAILGDSIQRILRFTGYIVEAQDYIDDLGLQVAQVIWGILNLSKNELPQRKGLLKKEDQWQGRVYTLGAKMFKEIPEVRAQVRELMIKMEFNDPSIKEISRKIVDECLNAQYQTALRLGIYHDLKIHESNIVWSGLYEKAYQEIVKNDKIIKEISGSNAGCLVAKLEEFPEFKGMKTTDKILVRSNGTSTYTGKDLVFQMWKVGLIEDPMKYTLWMTQPNNLELWTTSEEGESSTKFAYANTVVNVIGSEQKYPQKVLRHILKLMGYEDQFKRSFHLAYEHVWFKEGKNVERFAGREGTWIGYSADEVLDEAVKRAYKEVDSRNPDLPKDKKKQIAENIGKAAVKYSMLKVNLGKIVVFDYDKALSFVGETGPYLQYAYTRICGILRKAGKWKTNYNVKNLSEHEKMLIKTLVGFPDVVEQVAKNLRLNTICDYAHNLASVLDKFYEFCPVLKAETKTLKNFRLTLVDATRITLKNALYLLGLEALERM